MSSIHQHLLVVVLLLIYSCFVYADGNLTISIQCFPDQASALLQLKRSFHNPNLSSWQAGTDCCHWEGIACDTASGWVIALDLGERDLQSHGLDPILFNLTLLQNLSIGSNNFMGSHLPALGFERLTELIHLNLSYSEFFGQIPIGIACLTKLVSLDLSNNNLYLHEPSFQTLIANLCNLKELYLDEVDISSSGAAGSSALVESVPQLRILSLGYCGLSSPIHPSLSRLRSLVVINLQGNYFSGRVPEFFANFSSLSTLQLNDNIFEELFPPRILQLRNLKILDVSFNSRLFGHLQDFPVGSYLETLNLAGTNFSNAIPNSFGNFKSLKLLGLSTRGIPKELPSLIGKLESLDSLLLSGSGLSEPMPSWIGSLKYLRDLTLFDFNFSGPIPSWIGNLTNLATLQLDNCNFSGTIPSWIGNLTQLQFLDLSSNNLNGTIPSSIGNLTQLSSLDLSSNNLHGTIPSSIGNLTQLQFLDLSENNLSGTIPSSIGNSTQLSSLDLSSNNIHGTIPSSIGNLTQLQFLYLWNNNLSGTIPFWIGNLTRLQFLGLSSNNLNGEIPKSLFTLPALQALLIGSNSLSGSLQDFSTLSSFLVRIDLSSNKLSGSISKSFFQLLYLEALNLGSNNLVGTKELSSFWGLRNFIFLSLSNNMLLVIDGKDNSFFPSLPKIESLGLASCNLTKVPSVLRYLDELYLLDLSCNQINGIIPDWIWETWKDSFEYLNLSHNMFTSVEQSPSLVPMNYLSTLDLSFNRLQGNIPIPLIQDHSYANQILDYSNNKFSFVLPNFTAYMSQDYGFFDKIIV